MTDKEKQIEEMAKDLDEVRELAIGTVGSMNNGFGGWYAKHLYEKGYRKQSKVAKELLWAIHKAVTEAATESIYPNKAGDYGEPILNGIDFKTIFECEFNSICQKYGVEEGG